MTLHGAFPHLFPRPSAAAMLDVLSPPRVKPYVPMEQITLDQADKRMQPTNRHKVAPPQPRPWAQGHGINRPAKGNGASHSPAAPSPAAPKTLQGRARNAQGRTEDKQTWWSTRGKGGKAAPRPWVAKENAIGNPRAATPWLPKVPNGGHAAPSAYSLWPCRSTAGSTAEWRRPAGQGHERDGHTAGHGLQSHLGSQPKATTALGADFEHHLRAPDMCLPRVELGCAWHVTAEATGCMIIQGAGIAWPLPCRQPA